MKQTTTSNFPFFCKVLCHSGHVHNQSYSGGFKKSKIHLNDFPLYFYSNQAKRPQPTIRHDFLTCITNHKLIVRFLLCFVCFILFQCNFASFFLLFAFATDKPSHFLLFFTGGENGKLLTVVFLSRLVQELSNVFFMFSSRIRASTVELRATGLLWQIPVF